MSNASPQPSVCSEPLLFSFNDRGSRQVIADFSAGYLSSDGGMLFLRQIDEGLGISRSLARCFYDARNPLFIEHSVRELVAQRLLGMAAGYEDLNDHNLLRLDPLFAVAVGKEDPLGSGRAPQDQGKALASASTLNRLELGNNKNTSCHKISADHEAIEDTLLRKGVRCLPKESLEVVIDLDTTDDPLHGHQEGRFFHGFYGCYCLPLSARYHSGPNFGLAMGTRLAARSMPLRRSFRRCENVAPRRGSLCVPTAASVAKRLWLGAKKSNQSSIIVWAWRATAGYGN